MMDVLAQLERRDTGLTIRDLVGQLHLPRTTIYRILNTLQMHDMVHRDDNGAYKLGRRLLGLASHVATGASEVDLVSIAQPFLDGLAHDIGEGVKLSVLDKNAILVLAAAQGRREYALNVAPGQRMEAHAAPPASCCCPICPKPISPTICPSRWWPSPARPSPIRAG